MGKMKRFIWLLVVPVFFSYGPNLVGYETIIETTLDDANIQNGAKMACEIQLDNGAHWLIEGKLLQTEPWILLYYNPVVDTVLPYPVENGRTQFCLTSESQML